MSYLWKTNKDLQRAFRLHLVASSPPPICSLFSPWPVLIWIKHYIRIFQAQHKHKYPVYCLLTPRPADAGVVVFQSQQCSWQDQDECAQYYAKYVDTPGPGGDQPPAPPGTVMGDWQQRRVRTGVHCAPSGMQPALTPVTSGMPRGKTALNQHFITQEMKQESWFAVKDFEVIKLKQ